MKPPKQYSPWICIVCGRSDQIYGGITQSSLTRATAGRCNVCEMRHPLLKRIQVKPWRIEKRTDAGWILLDYANDLEEGGMLASSYALPENDIRLVDPDGKTF